MRKVVVLADAHFLWVDATVTLKSLGHHNSPLLLSVFAIAFATTLRFRALVRLGPLGPPTDLDRDLFRDELCVALAKDETPPQGLYKVLAEHCQVDTCLSNRPSGQICMCHEFSSTAMSGPLKPGGASPVI